MSVWNEGHDRGLSESQEWHGAYWYMTAYSHLHIRQRASDLPSYEVWRWGRSGANDTLIVGPFEALDAAKAAYMLMPRSVDYDGLAP
jgi:hypothetical protein